MFQLVDVRGHLVPEVQGEGGEEEEAKRLPALPQQLQDQEGQYRGHTQKHCLM